MVTNGGSAFDEFVEDYYAECDEHLSAIRRLLLGVEARPAPAFESSEVGELARRLHTLKGLSGMVGLAPAEELAHTLEDVLRGSVPTDAPVRKDVLDCLFAGIGLLDRSIQSKRGWHPVPDHREFVTRAREFMSSRDGADGAAVAIQTLPAPASSVSSVGPNFYRFEFTPSPAYAARGVGVELVRQRLRDLGEIVRTTPRAVPGGAVTFEFVVRLSPGVRPPPEWSADGIAWEITEVEAAPVARAESASRDDRVAPAANVVRVELARVDDLMRMIGEIVVLRSRLDEALRRGNGSVVLEDLRETNVALERQLRSLREGVMRIRLVPIGEVFDRMRFTMRDVIRESGKAVRLEFSGSDAQIDKVIVDRMLEPLLHLVRNAAIHGIEDRADRLANGKPPEGTIALRARAAGDRIVLEAEDDGAGIDVRRVGGRAVSLGLLRGDHALSDDELLDVICSPGFSTRETADRGAGRGVGMAVVRGTIRALGGELSMSTVPGQGTRFTIELPLTLMIADALLVTVGDQTMAVPQLSLREILRLDATSITALQGNQVISYRGSVLPLLTLHRLFELAPPDDARPHVLVVGSDTQLVGLVVDGLVGLREIVVHPVSDPLVAVPGIAGATELADGRISLIIDVAALIRRAREAGSRGRLVDAPQPAHAQLEVRS
jgi:two-component system chemotaxis sensor kinase CheA